MDLGLLGLRKSMGILYGLRVTPSRGPGNHINTPSPPCTSLPTSLQRACSRAPGLGRYGHTVWRTPQEKSQC